MTKLPKTVKIGHLSYALSKTKEPLYHEGQAAWGLHSTTRASIVVSSDLPTAPHEAEIVMHECFHGLFDFFELSQMEGITTAKEEMLVSTLSKGIVMLLKDNPKLTAYIVESVKEKK